MNLSVFDFRDDFTLHEIVCLCLGIDPAFGYPTRESPYFTEYRELLNAAKESARMGNAECARAHFASQDRTTLYPNLLYTKWALSRIPFEPGVPAWTEVPRDRWPEDGFDPDKVDEWRFRRGVIARWLAGRSFKPAYDFGKSGGRIIFGEEKNEPKDEPKLDQLGSRERSTLLKLVLGMAIRGYSYDPAAQKNVAVSDIVSDLEELGLSVSDDTVRKYLKEAMTSHWTDQRGK